jgi:hypothetical protein
MVAALAANDRPSPAWKAVGFGLRRIRHVDRTADQRLFDAGLHRSHRRPRILSPDQVQPNAIVLGRPVAFAEAIDGRPMTGLDQPPSDGLDE